MTDEPTENVLRAYCTSLSAEIGIVKLVEGKRYWVVYTPQGRKGQQCCAQYGDGG